MQSRERFQPSWRKVNNSPDRPQVEIQRVSGNGAQIVTEVVMPINEARVIRGRTLGGGTSIEALRRARRQGARH